MLTAQKPNQVTDSFFSRFDLLAKLAPHGFCHFCHAVLTVDEVPQETSSFVEPNLSHRKKVADPLTEAATTSNTGSRPLDDNSTLDLPPIGHAKRSHLQEILTGEKLVLAGPANG